MSNLAKWFKNFAQVKKQAFKSYSFLVGHDTRRINHSKNLEQCFATSVPRKNDKRIPQKRKN